MRAGFATADITPATGMERPGNYYKILTDSIHDPLRVRAAVLDSGGVVLAVVGVDTLALPEAVVADARRRIAERTGIPGECVMIAASHTHSGGPLKGNFAPDFADAPALIRELAIDESVASSALYREWVAAQIATAVERAHAGRRPARLSVGRGEEREALFNRRFRMRDGRVYTHPGKGNPDIVEPAGPVDPEVGVIGAWDESGALLGCLVDYGCHCTTSPGGASADYVHYLERVIQGTFGADAVVVFLAGAAGDVTQVDNGSMREREFGERWARHVGARVGAEAVKVLVTAEPGVEGPLAHDSRVLDVERRPPSPARLAAARACIEAGPSEPGPDAAWLFAKEIVILDHLVRTRPPVAVEVQALQIGPAVLVSNPAEYFAESGLAIKAGSPFPYTFVVSLANGCAGYVPPRRAFEPGGGGYETVLSSLSCLRVGTAERIAETGIELASGMTPGAVPEIPRVPAVETPWSYGVLGPELD